MHGVRRLRQKPLHYVTYSYNYSVLENTLKLWDKVTANLDAETTEQIMDNLLGLPCTMVVITHDVSGGFMNRFDRVYRMELGGVCTEVHADA